MAVVARRLAAVVKRLLGSRWYVGSSLKTITTTITTTIITITMAAGKGGTKGLGILGLWGEE